MRENIGDDGDDVEKMYESERASKTFFFKVPKGSTPRIFLHIFDSFLILRMHN